MAGRLGAQGPGESIGSDPPVVHLTVDHDHQRLMDMLGMKTIRRGRDGSPDSPYAANYDESKANPYPVLPDPLILREESDEREDMVDEAAAGDRRTV
jgi:hypothetical protein